MVSPFLDPVTSKKIRFIYSSAPGTTQELIDCFGKEVGCGGAGGARCVWDVAWRGLAGAMGGRGTGLVGARASWFRACCGGAPDLDGDANHARRFTRASSQVLPKDLGGDADWIPVEQQVAVIDKQRAARKIEQ